MVQEATLDRMNQELKKNKQLIERGDDLLQVDELYEKLARAANSLTAKDDLIQVRVDSALTFALFALRDICNHFPICVVFTSGFITFMYVLVM